MPVELRRPLLPLVYLIARTRELLHLNQQQLADRVRSSLRTVQRWEARRATPSAREIHWMADTVRSVDPEIAAHLDVWAPRPAPPSMPEPARPIEGVSPAPAPAPPPPLHVLVDSVLCAAAEAMGVAPQAVRPAVLAAFARSCEARVSPEQIVATLTPPPAAPEPAPAPPPPPKRKPPRA
jgi:transcriptional regulator with XRE-family HTH domain